MIKITDDASKKIKNFLEKRGKGLGIRIGIKTTGCSGLAYQLEYVDVARDEDLLFESQGIQIYVDKKSLVYIDGTTLTWAKNGLNEGFEFLNPNERDRCGCGESFRI